MEIWVFLSISAAIFQTLRFILQKFLSDTRLGVAGATFSRFIYSAPILLVLAPLWFGYFGYPIVTGSFFIFYRMNPCSLSMISGRLAMSTRKFGVVAA